MPTKILIKLELSKGNEAVETLFRYFSDDTRVKLDKIIILPLHARGCSALAFVTNNY